MDEIKATQIQGRGAQAEALLGNELLQASFKYLNDEYIAAWRRTTVKDTEAREKLWQAVQIVALIQDHLKKFVADGRIATKDLASIKYLKP